jgi:hypothetical protein
MLRLPGTAVGRVVDIAVGGRIRYAVPVLEAGRNNGFQHGRMLHWAGLLTLHPDHVQNRKRPRNDMNLGMVYGQGLSWDGTDSLNRGGA